MLLAYRPELQENFAFHVQKQLAERIAQFPHLWAPSVQVHPGRVAVIGFDRVQKLEERIAQYPHLWAPSVQVGPGRVTNL